ncbi:MAG: hypothetical protein QXV52_08665 [Nitrososphaeria archaeon]
MVEQSKIVSDIHSELGIYPTRLDFEKIRKTFKSHDDFVEFMRQISKLPIDDRLTKLQERMSMNEQAVEPTQEQTPLLAKKSSNRKAKTPKIQQKELKLEEDSINEPISTDNQKIQVTIEFKNFGSVVAFFDDVVVENDFIIFVNKIKSNSYLYYLPDFQENMESPIAVSFRKDKDRVYLVYPTGLRFQYGNFIFQIVVIYKAKEKEKGEITENEPLLK